MREGDENADRQFRYAIYHCIDVHAAGEAVEVEVQPIVAQPGNEPSSKNMIRYTWIQDGN